MCILGMRQTAYERWNDIVPSSETLGEEEERVERKLQSYIDIGCNGVEINNPTAEEAKKMEKIQLDYSEKAAKLESLASARRPLYDRFRKFGY